METILHRIKAYLYNNPLTTGDIRDFIAHAISERSLNRRYSLEVGTTQYDVSFLLKEPPIVHAIKY
ncbi:MAG: hypothetical protein LBB85_10660 [Dysgonamonadaceae bacterium]|jgi:hypothetical protein|nr:hypothetical protein [Dysgonamonadaceae bacterium]